MSVALDLGAHTLRSLRYRGESLTARRQRSAYAVIPDVPAQREMLRQARIGFANCDGNLVLMGDAALEMSRVFDLPAIDLLPSGMVPSNNPVARQITAIMVDALLGTPQQADEVCCFIQPAQVIESRDERTESQEFFRRLIRIKGFQPLSMTAGQALVFAELARDGFSGIAAVLGASGCELTIAHRGVPMFSRSIPRGGRWLDEQVARLCDMKMLDSAGRMRSDIDQAARLREAAKSAITSPTIDAERHLQFAYHDLVNHLCGEILRSLEETPRLRELPQPASFVLSGGLFEAPGLADLIRQKLATMQLPIRVQSPRVASRGMYAVARGCLINAELEITTRSFRAAA
jgi:hypothetical protein